MKKINIEIATKNIKIILFFAYLLVYYIFGADTEKVKYSEIILLLFMGLEFLNILKTKKIKYCIPIIIVFAFAFYCFLSNFWAINSELAIDKSKTLFILAVFLLITYNFFSNIENAENILLKIIMYAGIIFSIYIIMYYGISEYFGKLIRGERIGAEINNVNAIGLQTSISIIIAIFYGLYENNKGYFLLSIIPLIVSLGTGSRKVIILILVGLVLLFILKREEKIDIVSITKKVLIFIIVSLTFVYIAKVPMFSTAFERFQMSINSITGQGKVDNSTQTRATFIKAGIDQFLKTPILGIGIGNSGYITEQATGWFTYLHNNYVELLATTGIIGFCLYYSVYFYIIFNCVKMLKKKNKYTNIVLIIFLINIILEYAMVSYYSKITYIYILLGLISVEKARKDYSNEQNN